MPEDVSLDIVQKVINPIRKSSSANYDHHYEDFVKFVINRNGTVQCFKLAEVIEYFNFLVNRGFQSNTLRSVRSILREPLLLYFPEYDLSKDVLVNKLIRYVKSLKPKLSYNFPAWNLDLVVRMIQLRECQDLEYIFKKTLFVLFIACPYRVAEFKAISLASSSLSPHHVLLKTHLLFCSKNQSDSFCPLPIVVQKFEEDPRICPVTLINNYVRCTEALCRDRNVLRPDQLWIGVNLRPLSVNTISKWVKDIIFFWQIQVLVRLDLGFIQLGHRSLLIC